MPVVSITTNSCSFSVESRIRRTILHYDLQDDGCLERHSTSGHEFLMLDHNLIHDLALDFDSGCDMSVRQDDVFLPVTFHEENPLLPAAQHVGNHQPMAVLQQRVL